MPENSDSNPAADLNARPAPELSATETAEESRSDTPIQRALAGAGGLWIAIVSALALRSALRAFQRDGYLGVDEAANVVAIAIGAGLAFAVLGAFVSRPGHAFPIVPLRRLLIGAGIVIAVILSIGSGGTLGLLAALILAAWAWAAGGFALNLIGLSRETATGWERAVLAVALGLGLLSMAALILAAVGILNDITLAILLLLGVPGGVTGVIAERQARPTENANTSDDEEPVFVEYLCLAASAITVVVAIGVSFSPALYFDALHYHLTMSVTVLRESGLVERPDIFQTYFPLGLEMALAPAFWLQGEVAANLVCWLFLPLTGALLWSAGDRLVGRPVGGLAAAFVVLTPIVFQGATNDYTDLSEAFFLLCALWCLTVPDQDALAPKALAGAFLGLAVSFKLVAGYYVVPIGLLFALYQLRRVGLTSTWLRRLTALAGPAALFGLPWLIVRLVQTGNPVFPILNNVFKSSKWPPVNERFNLDQFGIGTSLTDLLRAPWEASFRPEFFGEAMPAWSMGLVPLVAVPALLVVGLRYRSRPHLHLWLLAAATAFAAWLLFSQYHRYGMAAWVMLALPVAAAAWLAIESLAAKKDTREAIAAVIVLGWLTFGITVGIATEGIIRGHYPTDVLLGRESREDYRRHNLVNYDALLYLEAQTRDTDDLSVTLGEPWNYLVTNRMYDVILPAELSPFTRIGTADLTPAERAAAMEEARLRWVVSTTGIPLPSWTVENILGPEFLTRYLKPEFVGPRTTVYRLVPAGLP